MFIVLVNVPFTYKSPVALCTLAPKQASLVLLPNPIAELIVPSGRNRTMYASELLLFVKIAGEIPGLKAVESPIPPTMYTFPLLSVVTNDPSVGFGESGFLPHINPPEAFNLTINADVAVVVKL